MFFSLSKALECARFATDQKIVWAGLTNNDQAFVIISSDGFIEVGCVCEERRQIRFFAGCTEDLIAESHPSRAAVLISSSDRLSAQLWCLQSGEILQEYSGHLDKISHFHFDECGEQLLTASRDGTVRLWDTFSGDCIEALFVHASGVFKTFFGSNRKRILARANDGTIKVWSRFSENLETKVSCCDRFLTDFFAKFVSKDVKNYALTLGF